jgi:hypothetical protein
MPEVPSRRGASNSDPQAKTLTDRVAARVNEAALAADRRAGSTRPKSTRHRSRASDRLAADVTRSAEQLREARSLRRVFLDLGDCYRDYRRRTGAPVSDDVRDAATRFRRELTMPALVSVAASLDQLEILSW